MQHVKDGPAGCYLGFIPNGFYKQHLGNNLMGHPVSIYMVKYYWHFGESLNVWQPGTCDPGEFAYLMQEGVHGRFRSRSKHRLGLIDHPRGSRRRRLRLRLGTRLGQIDHLRLR